MQLDTGILYNSGLVIRDRALVSTLTVFYQRTYLPTAILFGHGLVLWEAEFKSLFAERVFQRLPYFDTDVRLLSRDSRVNFQAIVSSLENRGVQIPKLSSDDEAAHIRQGLYSGMAEQYDIIMWLKTQLHKLQHLPKDDYLEALLDLEEVKNAFDMLNHLVRTDIKLPRLHDVKSDRPARDDMVCLEAMTIFSYFLPKLNSLHSDEILELRRKVKDTREGFTMHLQKLSKGLDGMVKAGERLEDLSGYARNIVETDLIPDYREFRRQLEAEQAGKTKKILDLAGKIMEVDAAPWTPKFWGQLLKALGMSAIETAIDQKERLTNRYQAYEFMKEVEDFGQR